MIEKGIRALIKNGLIVVLVTFVGYIYTYLYKVGYMRQYHIPLMFMEIKTIDLIHFAIIAILFLLAFFFHEFILKKNQDRRYKTHFWNNLKLFMLVFAAIVIYKLIFYADVKDYLAFIFYILFFIVLTLLITFIVSIFTCWSFRIEAKRDAEKKNQVSQEKQEALIRKKTMLIYTAVSTIVIFVSFFGFSFARLEAVFKRQYTYIEQPQPLVALLNYKDGFIVAPIEKDTIIPKYSYYEMSEDSVMYLKDLGTLKIADID